MIKFDESDLVWNTRLPKHHLAVLGAALGGGGGGGGGGGSFLPT